MTEHSDTITKMAVMTGAGFVVSYADVEFILRCASLMVPMVLSVIVFVRDSRKRRKHEKKN